MQAAHGVVGHLLAGWRHDTVQFVTQLCNALRVLRQLEQRPGEDCGGGFMTRNEHGHEVVAQLGVGCALPAQVHQKAEQRRVLHPAVVPGLQVSQVSALRRGLRCSNQLIQRPVDGFHVLPELDLTWHNVGGPGDVPVREVEGAAVLRLAEDAVHGLNHWRFLSHRPKTVIEHAQANDVQRHAAEQRLHVNDAAGGSSRVQGPIQRGAAVVKQPHHM